MSNGGHLYVEPSVLEVIGLYRQRFPAMLESGGFLAGYYKGNNLHITHLTEPQPKDKNGRYHFHRRDIKHVDQVTHWYKSSGGLINCLGEWHTHPESSPTPSGIDIGSWKKFIKRRQGQRAIFMIEGTQSAWAGELNPRIVITIGKR